MSTDFKPDDAEDYSRSRHRYWLPEGVCDWCDLPLVEQKPADCVNPEHIPTPLWTAGHWSPMLAIAEHLGDRESVDILTAHGIYANHCGGYDVHAWPCPIAADTLTYIYEETP